MLTLVFDCAGFVSPNFYGPGLNLSLTQILTMP